ncbi:MAG: ATP-binding cassette domain-containing protein [Oliverpabstia sp.]
MKLELHHLQKHYKQLHVLKDINLNFREGVYGLVGPNGAGKSTLMRLLVAAEFPESGEILWEGKNIREHRNDYKLRIGYLPQEFGFYKEFTGREMLHYTGLIKTVLPMEEIREQSSRLLELLDLMDKADVAVGKYSGGMKQRLGIAQAFLGYPDLVILDEATVGLDPMQRIRFKKFLKEYGKEKTVILSTHILSDLKDIADFLIFMDKGNIIYNGMMDREKNPDELYMEYFHQGEGFCEKELSVHRL